MLVVDILDSWRKYFEILCYNWSFQTDAVTTMDWEIGKSVYGVYELGKGVREGRT